MDYNCVKVKCKRMRFSQRAGTMRFANSKVGSLSDNAQDNATLCTEYKSIKFWKMPFHDFALNTQLRVIWIHVMHNSTKAKVMDFQLVHSNIQVLLYYTYTIHTSWRNLCSSLFYPLFILAFVVLYSLIYFMRRHAFAFFFFFLLLFSLW